MKKLATLLLPLILILSLITTAMAVTVEDNPSNITDVEEEAIFLLNSEGRVCAQKFEDRHSALKLGETCTFGRIVLQGTTGKVVRVFNRKIVTLDDNYRIAEGGTPITVKLKVIDEDVLDELGLFTSADIVDATITAYANNDETYTAFHRALTTDAGKEVARLYLKDSKTKYISIRYADWDCDEDMELCLRLGVIEKSNNDNNNPPADDDNSSSTDDNVPNPENQDVVLPWDTSISTGNQGNNVPNPENQDATLPW